MVDIPIEYLEKENPGLIQAAVQLHQEGKIGPNTYVVDLDSVRTNIRDIKRCADTHGVELYAMTKQYNRNPSINRVSKEEGVDKIVAVDLEGACHCYEQGMGIGHVGHLVQIPRHDVKRVLKMEPEVWTVYGYENAKFISEGAEKLGVVQDIIIQTYGPDDQMYEAQNAGVPLDSLIEIAGKIQKLPGVRLMGTTGFPVILYNEDSRKVEPLPNLASIVKGAKMLGDELGVEIEQINCPGTSSCATMEMVKDHGGTHGEPGSSYWGMAPQRVFAGDPGIPALVYMTEVSHIFKGIPHVMGGGFYTDDYYFDRMSVKKAFVGSNPDKALENKVGASVPEPKYIDYHAYLHPEPGQSVEVGDTAVYVFRPQVFYTRSAQIATVVGIKENDPKVEAVYDRSNRQVVRDWV